jgi:hypothetical protein
VSRLCALRTILAGDTKLVWDTFQLVKIIGAAGIVLQTRTVRNAQGIARLHEAGV